jgi:hypothetical protein
MELLDSRGTVASGVECISQPLNESKTYCACGVSSYHHQHPAQCSVLTRPSYHHSNPRKVICDLYRRGSVPLPAAASTTRQTLALSCLQGLEIAAIAVWPRRRTCCHYCHHLYHPHNLKADLMAREAPAHSHYRHHHHHRCHHHHCARVRILPFRP